MRVSPNGSLADLDTQAFELNFHRPFRVHLQRDETVVAPTLLIALLDPPTGGLPLPTDQVHSIGHRHESFIVSRLCNGDNGKEYNRESDGRLSCYATLP